MSSRRSRISIVPQRNESGISCYDESIDYLRIREEMDLFKHELHRVKTFNICGIRSGSTKSQCFCVMKADCSYDKLVLNAQETLFKFRYCGIYFREIEVKVEYMDVDDWLTYHSPHYQSWF